MSELYWILCGTFRFLGCSSFTKSWKFDRGHMSSCNTQTSLVSVLGAREVRGCLDLGTGRMLSSDDAIQCP